MTEQSMLINWENTLNQHEYTYYEFNKRFGIAIDRYLVNGVTPRNKTVTKIEDAMKKILTDERIPKHPAYGYATQEQIAELSRMGLGPDRDRLMDKIRQQNDNCGKVYK